MLPTLSAFLAASAGTIADHLWQSTVFACAAATMTLAFRRSRARVRYSMWLAASLKFFVPFAWLIALGSRMAGSLRSTAPQTRMYSVVSEVGTPFSSGLSNHATAAHTMSWWPSVLAALWLCGCIAVFVPWLIRWRRIASSLHHAPQTLDGREASALRRVTQVQGIRTPIALLLSPAGMEPAIFGIVRPVLLWPTALSEKLDDAQLDAVLTHEACHVRYRDNLAAALHMLVESLFWFHPLVWWIGARMVTEREHACDERVLLLGNRRQAYAEGLLRASAFCLAPQVHGVSGITGSNLNQRIMRVMTQPSTSPLTLAGKLVLAACTFAAFAAPVIFGVLHAPAINAQTIAASGLPSPPIESVSIKPHIDAPHNGPRALRPLGGETGHFTMTDTTLKTLVAYAYDVKPFQVSGGPEWTGLDTFDIDAPLQPELAAAIQELTPLQQMAEKKLIAQSILAKNFHLQLSRQTAELPSYVLEVAESGAKLTQPAKKAVAPDGEEIISSMVRIEGSTQTISITGPVGALVDTLEDPLGRKVVDKTGLSGTYVMPLKWTKGEHQEESIQASLQQQLGLVLTPHNEPVQIVTIHEVEQPGS